MNDAQTPSLTLHERLQLIRDRIQKAAEKSGRTLEQITLVAVCKTVTVDTILRLVPEGVLHLGENKIQEAVSKRDALKLGSFTHHFIGHLQSNKARKAIEMFDLIQSVHSLELAKRMDRMAYDMGKKQGILMEIKIGKEETKSGFSLVDVEAGLAEIKRLPHLSLQGLMTIGSHEVSASETRSDFKNFMTVGRRFRSKLGDAPIFSLGMSDDFEMAIEEGSTMVRIGRALFGERKAQ